MQLEADGNRELCIVLGIHDVGLPLQVTGRVVKCCDFLSSKLGPNGDVIRLSLAVSLPDFLLILFAVSSCQ